MSAAVIVLGASSYVGEHLVRRLLAGGHRVVGVSRRPDVASILLPEQGDTFRLVRAEEAGRIAGAGATIVNLAYPKYSAPHELYRQARSIVESVDVLAAAGAERIVQVSTLGVFGDPLPPDALPQRVARPPDDLYAESKLDVEHRVERLARSRGCEPAIVRLGNVIGLGSPLWVAALAQEILEGRPVAYEGEVGCSNATHVENAADYLAHVVGRERGELARFGTYHHLAELSRHGWAELLDAYSAVVGVPWSSAPRPESEDRGPSPLRRALKAPYGTRAGRAVRAAFGRIPDARIADRLAQRLRAAPSPHLRTGDGLVPLGQGYMETIASRHEFRTHTVPGWQPELGFADALAGISAWLRDAGYSLRPPPDA